MQIPLLSGREVVKIFRRLGWDVARCKCRESTGPPVCRSSSRGKIQDELVVSIWYLVFSEEKIKREVSGYEFQDINMVFSY